MSKERRSIKESLRLDGSLSAAEALGVKDRKPRSELIADERKLRDDDDDAITAAVTRGIVGGSST